MKTSRIAITFAAALSIAACAEGTGDKEAVGTLVGAGLGGLAGSQVGSGSGKLAAVGVGVLLGGLLGRHVGKSLDRADRIAADRAAQQSFEHERIGTTTSWSNPDSGHSGTFTPTRTYQTARGQPCREYTTTVIIDGRRETAYGTACREPDGTWKIIN